MDQETILITGGSGYIASWVVAYALQTGAKVRATVRDPQNKQKTQHLTSLPGANERLELVALDLLKSSPEEFAAAVLGCTLVAHTASPFPSAAPKHEDELIKPAVEGTLAVLRACLGSTTIRKVVVTSSVAATTPSDEGGKFGEKDWTDPNNTGVYSKSKTLAERAAWDFYKENAPQWSLCTINPSFVFGPTLVNDASGTSVETALRFLSGSLPMVPKVSFAIADVRDVAKAHIKALALPSETTQGRRFIVCGNSYWMKQMCDALRPEFSPKGYAVPKYEAPYGLLWLYSFVDASVALILPMVGKMTEYDSSPSREVLQVEYTPFEKTMQDMGHSLVYHGLLKRTAQYTAPNEGWTPLAS